MRKKHPTLGKKDLTNMYFLRRDNNTDPNKLIDESPILENSTTKDGFLKFKNYK
jgi:hypothetical protein